MYTNPLDPATQSLSTWNEVRSSSERPDRKIEKLSFMDNNEVQGRIQEATLRTMPPVRSASMDQLKGRATIGAHREQSALNLFNL